MTEQTPVEPSTGPFEPLASDRQGPGSGPDWTGPYVQASLDRVRQAQDPLAQAAVEALVVAHSIRSLVLWGLVIITLEMIAGTIVFLIVMSGGSSL